MNQIEVMNLWLEALGYAWDAVRSQAAISTVDAATKTLRAEIERLEKCEPVAALEAASRIEELERQLTECQRERDELVEVLKQFAECDLNDGNCASLEVATRRIRSLANAALAKVGANKGEKL